MSATIIACMDATGVIGRKDGVIPWKETVDLSFFKRATMDRDLIVGSTTFRTLPPLPGRRVHVATRRTDVVMTKADSWGTLDQLLDRLPNAFVAGGGQIYHQAVDDLRCTSLLLSILPYMAECGPDQGVSFPDLNWLLLGGWRPIETKQQPCPRGPITFMRWQRQ